MAVRYPPNDLIQEWGAEIHAFLWALLQAVRGLRGNLYPTSWHRNALENYEAGGDEFSQHLVALALDIGGDAEILGEALESTRRVGLIAVDERASVGIIHVQRYPAGYLEGLRGRYTAD